MNLKWEIWGVVGIIAIQSFFIWLVYCMSSEVCKIYFLQMP